MIDWKNPKAKISNHFTVEEACWLPKWSALHNPSEAEKANILKMAAVMDKVRDLLGKPISVHCWIRPVLNCLGNPYNGQDYNVATDGALHSAHRDGRAVDWDCGEDCNVTRSTLLSHLEALGLRMEDHNGPWVHLDTALPNPNRFFKA